MKASELAKLVDLNNATSSKASWTEIINALLHRRSAADVAEVLLSLRAIKGKEDAAFMLHWHLCRLHYKDTPEEMARA